MRLNIINFLICPKCQTEFLCLIYKKRKKTIIEGELKCKKCNKKFQIKNRIPYFTLYKKPNSKIFQKLRKITIQQEIPKKWMQFYSKKEKEALNKEWQWMFSAVKKNKSAVHLDFASGTGRFLREIIPKTKGEIVALDNGCDTCQELQYFLKKIRRYSRVSIVCADARKMPFKNGVFDSVSSWHGLDEPKMEKAIKEAKRVLKKGGYFVASGIHYQEGSKSFQRAKKHHINFLTKESIIKFLRKIGFRNIEHKIFFEGQWNEKKSYLPVFNDWYMCYAVKAQK